MQMNEADRATLTALNAAVTSAIQQRRQWLDEKIAEYAEVQIGEPLYELNTGGEVGVVIAHYRFWRDRDEGVRDTTLSINYEYRDSRGWRDNTSRQIGVEFGGRRRRDAKLKQLLEMPNE